MKLSLRAYAKHRGVSDTAVRKAIKSGRITVQADHLIDPDVADEQWNKNTDPSKVRSSGQRSNASITEHPETDCTGALDMTYEQAKLAHEVLKAEIGNLELKILNGELIDRKKALEKVFVLARRERDVWINWPARVSAALAVELQVEEHALYTALTDAVRDELMQRVTYHRGQHELQSGEDGE